MEQSPSLWRGHTLVKRRPIEFVGIFAGILTGGQTESLLNVQYQALSTIMRGTRTTPGFI